MAVLESFTNGGVMDVVPLNSKICIHTFVSDTQGCGAVRMINPGFYLTNAHSPGYAFHYTWSLDFIQDVEYYRKYTFVIFQRPAHDSHWRWIQWFKNNVTLMTGVPCIADVDDLYFDVPNYNYANVFFNTFRKQAEQVLQWVNGISVSTGVLAGEMRKFNPNVAVLSNHLPKYMWGEPQFAGTKKDKVRIIYPCSANHFPTRELVDRGITRGDVGDGLLAYVRDTVDKYDWWFIGHYPHQLQDLVEDEKIYIPPWHAPYDYPAFLKGCGADIGIAPLLHSRFNESKSNIKMLEFTAAGIPGVYSDIIPYWDASCKAIDDDEFISHIENLANDAELRRHIWDTDHAKMRPRLFYEENGNGLKHVNSYMSLFGKRLLGPDEVHEAKHSVGDRLLGNKNAVDLTPMICGYMEGCSSVSLYNMIGTHLVHKLIGVPLDTINVVGVELPVGIEQLIGTKARFYHHHTCLEDVAIVDCGKLGEEDFLSYLAEAITAKQLLFIINTTLSPHLSEVARQYIETAGATTWSLKKAYDFWGGMFVYVPYNKDIKPERFSTGDFVAPQKPILCASGSIVEVFRPEKNDAIKESTATEVFRGSEGYAGGHAET